MYEESIHFFTDFFKNNRSVLSLLNADYTFLNEPLAKHYGIAGVTGPEWRRVDGDQEIRTRRNTRSGGYPFKAVGRITHQSHPAR